MQQVCNLPGQVNQSKIPIFKTFITLKPIHHHLINKILKIHRYLNKGSVTF